MVIGRGINIHHHVMVLQEALGWEDIRYEEAFSGGQFGIKLDITSEALAGPRPCISAARSAMCRVSPNPCG